MKRNTLTALLMLIALTACTATRVPRFSWGDRPVREIVQMDNCTVYGLVSDPEHQYWTLCGSERP